MSILKLLARTFILFVCSIVQVIGVLTEGVMRLSAKTCMYLNMLDNKLEKETVKKHKKKTEAVPT